MKQGSQVFTSLQLPEAMQSLQVRLPVPPAPACSAQAMSCPRPDSPSVRC